MVRRSEGWWKLREALDPNFNPTIEFPPDDELTGDLTAPKWKVVSDGKIQVESKDELRKPERLGRSTDAGDAVMQLFVDSPTVLYEYLTPADFRKRRHPDDPWDDEPLSGSWFGRQGRFGPGAY